MQKAYFSTKELAEILGISTVAVFKKIQRGQIKAQKLGRNYIIPRESLKGIIYDDLTERLKKEIKQGVTKAVREYGETLKLLGKE